MLRLDRSVKQIDTSASIFSTDGAEMVSQREELERAKDLAAKAEQLVDTLIGAVTAAGPGEWPRWRLDQARRRLNRVQADLQTLTAEVQNEIMVRELQARRAAREQR
jgi:hypothetical protein